MTIPSTTASWTPPFRILSIDGGGIKGIIPALVLDYIEKTTGKQIATLFDLIAGTSTGGILATILTKPSAQGAPEFTAAQVADLYVRWGAEIFPKSLWHTINNPKQFFGPKYPPTGIEPILKSYLGEARLKDTLTNILVTAYEIQKRIPWFFRTDHAKRDPVQFDFPLWQVARSTSAAPTYFAPESLASGDGSNWALVDGGVFANNPAMCAVAEVLTLRPGAEILLVSLGTGEHTDPVRYATAKNWGLAGWAVPLLNVVFDGISKTTDYQLRQLYPELDGRKRYYRFETELSMAEDSIDDTTSVNLGDLKQQAAELIQRNSADLNRLAKQLLSYQPQPQATAI